VAEEFWSVEHPEWLRVRVAVEDIHSPSRTPGRRGCLSAAQGEKLSTE